MILSSVFHKIKKFTNSFWFLLKIPNQELRNVQSTLKSDIWVVDDTHYYWVSFSIPIQFHRTFYSTIVLLQMIPSELCATSLLNWKAIYLESRECKKEVKCTPKEVKNGIVVLEWYNYLFAYFQEGKVHLEIALQRNNLSVLVYYYSTFLPKNKETILHHRIMVKTS